jgi:DNA polymerase III subunit chi
VTRIDFYFDAEDKLDVAARLVQKAYVNHHRVVVLAPHREQSDSLDRRLWAQPPLAFLPHCPIDHTLAGETPILLAPSAAMLPDTPHRELLLNLSSQVPDGFAQFERLIEIVGLDETDKAPARERFRHYRSNGYEIVSHRLGTTA